MTESHKSASVAECDSSSEDVSCQFLDLNSQSDTASDVSDPDFVCEAVDSMFDEEDKKRVCEIERRESTRFIMKEQINDIYGCPNWGLFRN